jgi:hypothetical protein
MHGRQEHLAVGLEHLLRSVVGLLEQVFLAKQFVDLFEHGVTSTQ